MEVAGFQLEPSEESSDAILGKSFPKVAQAQDLKIIALLGDIADYVERPPIIDIWRGCPRTG